MITTIQINDNVKRTLERLKESSKESYEDVVVRLISEKELAERKQEELLIEGCKVMAEDSLKITKEWERIDAELDWEWDGEL